MTLRPPCASHCLAERRLRGSAPAPALRGRRLSHRQSAPDAEAVAGKVAAELAGILREVKQGARLLYDGLPVHSLGEDQLCRAVTAHLGRPCIADAERLLSDLASAAEIDMDGLRRSSPELMRKLEGRAAEVQAAIQVSRDYWLEMAAVLAEQREARPAHLRVVRSSQCLHRQRRRLSAKGWQPRAYDPETRPACASLIRGVVSRDRCALFSDIAVRPDINQTALKSRIADTPNSPGALQGGVGLLIMTGTASACLRVA